ncbi:CoA-transferase [Mesorhizobium sp. BHbdii]
MAWDRKQIAVRAARELQDGHVCQSRIGIPTLVTTQIPEGIRVTLQSVNGMLGIGPFPTEDEIDVDFIMPASRRDRTFPFGVLRLGAEVLR